MRLALSEGRLSKWRDLRHELTPRELTELMAFSVVDPWGDRRDDIRQALMTALIVSATNGEKIDLHKLTNYMDPDTDGADAASEFMSPNAAAVTMSQQMPGTVRH